MKELSVCCSSISFPDFVGLYRFMPADPSYKCINYDEDEVGILVES
jgi:hypothetical protein